MTISPLRPEDGQRSLSGPVSGSGASRRSMRDSSFWRACACRVFCPAMLRRMNSSCRSISARCRSNAPCACLRRRSRSRRYRAYPEGNRSSLPPCSSSTSPPTRSTNSRSCVTSRRAPLRLASSWARNSTPRRSRWLVGSSSRSSAGESRARARATRVRSPPDSDSSVLACIAAGMPRPSSAAWARGRAR